MQIHEAFIQMIKVYWEDKEEATSFKGKKYNKKYFDAMKEEFHPSAEKPEDKLDKKIKKKGSY